MENMLNFDECLINDFTSEPIVNEPFFNFSTLLTSALSIERDNNEILDTFTWNSAFVLPVYLNQIQITDILAENQALWLEHNVDFEYFYKNNLWQDNKSILDVTAYDFIEQRFRFLSRSQGHQTRTQLTSQEIIFLEYQTSEFFDNFQHSNLCACEIKSIISWLVRLVNIILSKNDIIDLDFERINNSFEYYKKVNMNEVRCFLNMYENNHNLEEKFFLKNI